jgi:hypothetical protein
MRRFLIVELEKYRSKTFRLLPRLRLHFERDAIHFVNERGFIFFWPVKKVLLPSLWGGVAGEITMMTQLTKPGDGRIICWEKRNGITPEYSEKETR